MNSIISKYDINHFLAWSDNHGGTGQHSLSDLFSEHSLADHYRLQPKSIQLANGETVRITQHVAFQLSRRSIELEVVSRTINNPDKILTDSLDSTRQIYQYYRRQDTCINITLAQMGDGEKLCVGAWVSAV